MTACGQCRLHVIAAGGEQAAELRVRPGDLCGCASHETSMPLGMPRMDKRVAYVALCFQKMWPAFQTGPSWPRTIPMGLRRLCCSAAACPRASLTGRLAAWRSPCLISLSFTLVAPFSYGLPARPSGCPLGIRSGRSARINERMPGLKRAVLC